MVEDGPQELLAGDLAAIEIVGNPGGVPERLVDGENIMVTGEAGVMITVAVVGAARRGTTGVEGTAASEALGLLDKEEEEGEEEEDRLRWGLEEGGGGTVLGMPPRRLA